MLIFVSDLHLTDSTTARNVNADAFALMAAYVRETAVRRNAQELNLVLLGDIFDLVRTDYWHRTGVSPERRPWGGKLDPRTAMHSNRTLVRSQFSDVLSGIIVSEAAQKLQAALQSLAKGPAPFRVTYVVGNHDRVLWNFPELRQQITTAFPEISDFRTAFESDRYGVLARHGHEWDVNTHGWHFREKVLLPTERVDRFSAEAYEVQAIGEVITAELMSGLVYHAREGGAPAKLVEQLKDVNNLRPILDVFEWLEWFGEDRTGAHQEILYNALREALEGVLQSSLAKQWDRLERDIIISADLIDRLQQARAVLLGTSFKSFKGRVAALKKLHDVATRLFGDEEDRLLKGAASEAIFQRDGQPARIERVIYGHTHRARHEYFAAEKNGRVKMYINTGTYLPLITRTADRRSFASSIQMSLVYVYREDEDAENKRPGTSSLDIWNGVRRKIYV